MDYMDLTVRCPRKAIKYVSFSLDELTDGNILSQQSAIQQNEENEEVN